MIAHEHLQGEQLRMFIPAKELINTAARDVYGGEDPPYEGQPMTLWEDDDVRYLKLEEAEHEGLMNEIRDSGVLAPVELAYQHAYPDDTTTDKIPFIVNGHHRIAVAHDIDPEMLIPVQYVDR